MIRNDTPFPIFKEIHTETSSLRTLKIMPNNLCVHEFGFCTQTTEGQFDFKINLTLLCLQFLVYTLLLWQT